MSITNNKNKYDYIYSNENKSTTDTNIPLYRKIDILKHINKLYKVHKKTLLILSIALCIILCIPLSFIGTTTSTILFVYGQVLYYIAILTVPSNAYPSPKEHSIMSTVKALALSRTSLFILSSIPSIITCSALSIIGWFLVGTKFVLAYICSLLVFTLIYTKTKKNRK